MIVDNRIGFIDTDNNLVIGYEIPYNKALDYIFKDGYCVIFAPSAHLPLNLRKRNQQERAQILPAEDSEETPYRERQQRSLASYIVVAEFQCVINVIIVGVLKRG